MSSNCSKICDTFKSQTKNKVIVQLINYIKNCWPNDFKNCELIYYIILRNKFNIADYCLFYYDRFVIPSEWKKVLLKIFHDCHTGVVRLKMISQSYVWWPSIQFRHRELCPDWSCLSANP